jgi:type I restriction enzyme, S subunit
MNLVWDSVKFADAPVDIIDGDRGKNYPKQNEFHEDGYCLFLNTGNVTVDGFRFSNCQFVTDDKDRVLRKGRLVRQDVVMTTRGTLGNVGYFNDNVPYDNIRINSGMVIFRTVPEKLLPSFLYQYLRSAIFNKQVQAIRSGAAQPQLPIRDIKTITLPLPSIEVQNKLVSILAPYDDLIESNRRRIKLLEEAARQLYKEWFVRFRFPGHEHIKIIDGMPEGWSSSNLGDLVDVIKDSVDPTHLSSETVYVGLEHIPRRSFTLNQWEASSKVTSMKYKFQADDIIFCKIRPYFHKTGFALTDGITSSDAIVMRASDMELWPIVLCETSSDRFVALASQTVREGSKMPRADWTILKQKQILIPESKLLLQFSEQIQRICEQCKTLSLQNNKLTQARDILLPKLMNGEIAV